MKDDFSGVEVHGKVHQSQEVNSDDGVDTSSKIRILCQSTHEQGDFARSSGAESNIRERRLFPCETSIKVKGLRGLAVEPQFIGNFHIDDAHGGASIKKKFEVVLRPNLPFYLNQVASGKMKWKFGF